MHNKDMIYCQLFGFLTKGLLGLTVEFLIITLINVEKVINAILLILDYQTHNDFNGTNKGADICSIAGKNYFILLKEEISKCLMLKGQCYWQ